MESIKIKKRQVHYVNNYVCERNDCAMAKFPNEKWKRGKEMDDGKKVKMKKSNWNVKQHKEMENENEDEHWGYRWMWKKREIQMMEWGCPEKPQNLPKEKTTLRHFFEWAIWKPQMDYGPKRQEKMRLES